MEDMFEFVAVETDDDTFGFEVVEADGAGFWERKWDLLVVGSTAVFGFALFEHLVVLVS